MTTFLKGQNLPTINIVPRSWTMHLNTTIGNGGTAVIAGPVSPDFFNQNWGQVLNWPEEPCIGYEEVFSIIQGGASVINATLKPQFSMAGAVVTWNDLPTTALTAGGVTSQLLPAAIKRYPAFRLLRWQVINNDAGAGIVITGTLTLRAS